MGGFNVGLILDLLAKKWKFIEKHYLKVQFIIDMVFLAGMVILLLNIRDLVVNDCTQQCKDICPCLYENNVSDFNESVFIPYNMSDVSGFG